MVACRRRVPVRSRRPRPARRRRRPPARARHSKRRALPIATCATGPTRWPRPLWIGRRTSSTRRDAGGSQGSTPTRPGGGVLRRSTAGRQVLRRPRSCRPPVVRRPLLRSHTVLPRRKRPGRVGRDGSGLGSRRTGAGGPGRRQGGMHAGRSGAFKHSGCMPRPWRSSSRQLREWLPIDRFLAVFNHQNFIAY